MPLDFALYIVATIVVTGVVCIFVVAGIGWLLRKARMRRLAKAGVQYIGEDESMSMEQIAAAMDRAEDCGGLATRPFGEPERYDDRDRWAS